MLIEQTEMLRLLEKHRGDAVVMPVFRTAAPWARLTRNPKRDVPIGTHDFPFAMSKASSLALGLCLAQPSVKVILLDGDGSLLMNLGSLVTIANKGPKNLCHFVMNNGVYATTGGQEIPGHGAISYVALARAAGYAHTYEFDDLEEFAFRIEEILSRDGPVLVCIKAVPDIRGPEERFSGGQITGQVPWPITNLLEEFGAEQ
jgi:phosphonopyruvate decarboxylase